VPRPINLPVEIWQPMTSGRSIDFIAKKGIKGMTALSGEKVVEQFFTAYKDAAAEAGRSVTLGQDMSLGFGFYIADTQEEAIEKVRPYHDERYKWFSPFGLVRYVDEEGRMWGSPGAPARTPMVEDGVQQKAWLCGPPEHFIETLKDMEEKYPGLEDVFLQWPEGMPWSEMSAQLELFSKEVIPAFSGRG
jgi:alkanesulfonate monooxygenase SsuD/methylene tetrahydromethanopterin reductase-like flavin-dependent oxidoreductase (luciferase family)